MHEFHNDANRLLERLQGRCHVVTILNGIAPAGYYALNVVRSLVVNGPTRGGGLPLSSVGQSSFNSIHWPTTSIRQRSSCSCCGSAYCRHLMQSSTSTDHNRCQLWRLLSTSCQTSSLLLMLIAQTTSLSVAISTVLGSTAHTSMTNWSLRLTRSACFNSSSRQLAVTTCSMFLRR